MLATSPKTFVKKVFMIVHSSGTGDSEQEAEQVAR